MELNKTAIIETAYDGFVFSEIIQLDNCKVYRFRDETGSGEMHCYNLLEGIQLTYNNLNMESSHQKIELKKGFLQIDHCLEGCYELKLENSERVFIGKGDLSVIELGQIPFENSRIPMKKYMGLSIFIDINAAQKSIDKYFPYGNINLNGIRDRLCKSGAALIIRSRHEIDHIINELYTVDDRVRLPYSIIKTIELLLFLSLMEAKDAEQLLSFSESVYKATQECYKMITENPFEWLTVKDLAMKFAMSESSLKNCFQRISGHSIGSFMRSNRIKEAAALLSQKPHLSIGELAAITGYENQSKFSKAFKRVMGRTPSEVKKEQITLLEQKITQ